MRKLKSFLFRKIDLEKGYAIPNNRFWELWDSDKQEAVRRLGFLPRPYGELVGSKSKWVVSLPRDRRLAKILTSRGYRQHPDGVLMSPAFKPN